MKDKQLIAKIRELRQIKPSQDWVISLKKEIIGEQPTFGSQILSIFNAVPRTVSHHKLAYATVTAFMVLVAIVGGLFLIPTSNNNKLETELLAAAVQSRQCLEIANQKLENLAEVIKIKDQNEIALAIEDVNESIIWASKSITQDMINNPKALKEIASSAQKIDLNKKKLQTLGVIVDSDFQLNTVLQPLVQREIESLEKSTLNENQQLMLKEMKGLYKQGQYTDALEKILLITDAK